MLNESIKTYYVQHIMSITPGCQPGLLYYSYTKKMLFSLQIYDVNIELLTILIYLSNYK